MRIITGKYKGRHFDIPRSFKARPTTDFAKENIFNVLIQYVDLDGASALDLFSGTGSITLELLSRGCSEVISVELDRDHHRFIQECVKKLSPLNAQFAPLRMDVFRFLKNCRQQFDLVFADPPYALKELPTIPDLIFRDGQSSLPTQHSTLNTSHFSLLKPDGLFILEHGKDYSFAEHPHFVEHRAYGSVNFSLFR